MLTLNGKKMSKSTGNSVLPGELFDGDNAFFSKPYSPNTIRFFFLQAHYRSILDLSEEALVASEKGFKKLEAGIKNISKLKISKSTTGFDFSKWEMNCYKAMNDDFNTPLLIAELFNAIHYSNSVLTGKEKISKKDQTLLLNKTSIFFSEILGLKLLDDEKNIKSDELLRKTLDVLIKIRNKSRANRDFDTSDEIRGELNKLGITINDNEDKTTYEF
jgi:cysteinyl-tRNA synthetase